MRRRIRSAAFPVHRHSLPQLLVDGILVALAYFLAFRLRFDDAVPGRYEDLFEATLPWVVPVTLVVLSTFGLYQRLWTYVGQRDYEAVARGVLAIVLLTIVYRVHYEYPASKDEPAVVGWVEHDSPAAKIGAQPGDQLLEVP